MTLFITIAHADAQRKRCSLDGKLMYLRALEHNPSRFSTSSFLADPLCYARGGITANSRILLAVPGQVTPRKPSLTTENKMCFLMILRGGRTQGSPRDDGFPDQSNRAVQAPTDIVHVHRFEASKDQGWRCTCQMLIMGVRFEPQASILF